ncbi:MAG: hypothetical protein ACJ784_22460 [Myxococcales bacterium]
MNLPVRVLAALLLASAGSFAAGVPAQLVYQGRLLKADGSPVAQAIPLTFALYESANSGSPLWSETHSVDPSDGFFEVVLGDGTDASATSDISLASVIDGRQLWLGIKAGSDPEMSPRTVVGSAPYAMLAQPVAHAQTHMKGGGDEIASYDAAPDRIPMAGPSGALDPAWLPMLPLAKGGTGTATPRITRNLCFYVAAPNAPPPTIPLAPDLQNCLATAAFSSARQAPNVTWSFTNLRGTSFPSFSFSAGNGESVGLNVPLAAGDIIWPVVTPVGTFHEATFCLQVTCDATF